MALPTTTDSTSNPVLRWGIMSTAGIAKKVIDAMHQSPYATPVAVASRSLDTALAFIQETKVPKAYGSYEDLLQDSEIDAIYIPIPTGLRTEWVMRAARAGKHVLAEKPFASAEDVQKMRQVCEENNVLFMDNTMWLHHRRSYEMREKIPMFQLAPGTAGALQHARSTFNFELLSVDPNNIRFDRKLEPLGALGDLGWYTMGNLLFFFNDELPEKVWAVAEFDSQGAILRCDGFLWFSHNRKASFECSFIDCGRQDSDYESCDTIIRLNDFVLPRENEPILMPRDQYNDRATYTESNKYGEVIKVHTVEPHTQHVHLFANYARMAQNPTSTEAKSWGERSWKISKVLDALEQSAREEKLICL